MSELISYAQRMRKIRVLSAPKIDDITTAGAYRRVLSENFKHIGELAGENRRVIEEIINPVIFSEEELSEETIEWINALNDNLMDAWTHDNIDLPIMAMLSERLMKDAAKKGELSYLIHRLDEEIIACVALVVQTRRIVSRPFITEEVRRRGLKALEEIITFLDHDKFLELDEECRELVLINSRYGDGLFVSMSSLPEEYRKYRVQLLKRSIALCDDEFYRNAAPNYDWKYHKYRALQYFSSFDEFDNAAENNEEELQLIADAGEEIEALWLSDKDYFEELDDFGYIHFHTMRNKMHAGRITKKEYAESLYELYEKRNPDKYDIDSITGNIEIAAEYIGTLDYDNITEEEMKRAENIYRNALSYVFLMPKLGTFYELMDYYAPFLYNFNELPGGMSFEEMGIKSFAAFHPPTYIHSVMVAKITRCITKNLIKEKPELFTGICGCIDVSEVAKKAQKIADFAFHAALCHDFGKLIIIDTVFIYGRKILDSEFDIIKEHPALGAMMLEKYDSTREYADIARYHHVWYNGENGYPVDVDERNSRYKTIIDITACADCMDAATDSVGRSYRVGKTYDEFFEELVEGAGTRYAPYLPEILSKESVKKEILWLIEEGRQEEYRNTFLLLKNVTDQG